jgi:uncharacterized DUF497 family protein
MHLKEIIWIDRFKSKIEKKHNVSSDEVEQALFSGALFRRANRGRINGEYIYVAYGRTYGGRYLFIVFIYKSSMTALIISARDMTTKERKYYNEKKT